MTDIDWEALKRRRESAQRAYQGFQMFNHYAYLKMPAHEQAVFDARHSAARQELFDAEWAWDQAVRMLANAQKLATSALASRPAPILKALRDE